MPSWWGKSSSKQVKRNTEKESFGDRIHRKFKIPSEEKHSKCSRSPSLSKQVSRCQSFGQHSVPLPLPGECRTTISCKEDCHFSGLPLPRPDEDLTTPSIFSDSSTDSDDPPDSSLLSPQTSDYETGNRSTVNSPSSVMQKDQSIFVSLKNSTDLCKPTDLLFNGQIPPSSPKMGTLSSMSSPSRSPIRVSGFWSTRPPYPDMGLHGSAQCSSPGSGYNSGYTSIGPASPIMTSPGPSSRTQSGAISPLHPRADGAPMKSPTSHRLPLPPLNISNSSPLSPNYPTSPSSVSLSPNRAENLPSPRSHWKKGRLLGRGTFGHVYLGFNSESGEMCAMKEVILFSDDAKSKECAQHLGQEVALLSRLRHPNIVQYYGCETVDDTLYIYLEYVSGGSIYKLLEDYGQFGEIVIRSYTQQILSGLAYLHAKNTVHRDIKGANILVDPNGRVKLADFGMAKHLTGQSCPLSFKGSPFWMAPEVIKNSNGCNLAVDIWSLGCTVLEMATAKPPWSQYGEVPAMFKIGNSKELPVIPDHLSVVAKDFVRQCLERNPFCRPTAAQLLDHPFVKNAEPLARGNPSFNMSELPPTVRNAVRSLGIQNARKCSTLDSGVVNHQSRGLKSATQSRPFANKTVPSFTHTGPSSISKITAAQ